MTEIVFPPSVIEKAAMGAYAGEYDAEAFPWSSISEGERIQIRVFAKAALLAAFAEMERIGMARRGFASALNDISDPMPTEIIIRTTSQETGT